MVISMKSTMRATDNIFIEYFWHTVKQDQLHLPLAENGTELNDGLKWFINDDNTQKTNQGINRGVPVKLYKQVA